MGFENATPLSVVAYDSETGERVMGFDLASCPSITCETITADCINLGNISCDRISLGEMSFEMAFEIQWPHCSRKRFIKKLMGIGIPRNVANKYARYCAETRNPYGQQWNRICWMGIFG